MTDDRGQMSRLKSLSFGAAATAFVVVPRPLKNSDSRGRARGRKESDRMHSPYALNLIPYTFYRYVLPCAFSYFPHSRRGVGPYGPEAEFLTPDTFPLVI